MPSPSPITLPSGATVLATVHIAELWRYPVKSMRGEALQTADVTREGVHGDRLVQVRDSHGLVTARTRPGLLGLQGTTAPDGSALVDGLPWDDERVAERVRAAAGPTAHLAFDDDPEERFDILPLLVATDGAIAEFGQDGRRLRPNIVLGGVDGLAERDWEGKLLVVGDVVVLMHSLRGRCIVTTYDPESLHQDVDVLRDIRARFDGTLALNSAVLRPGTIGVGDRAVVIDAQS
jgi:uncharacterized protein YcbX